MEQPHPFNPRLQSAKRITWLLFSISVIGTLAILMMKWLKVFDAERFWVLVFWPLTIPSLVIHKLIDRHQRNCQLVARHLANTSLQPPTFGRMLAAALADLLLAGMLILLPACLYFSQIFNWASSRAVAEKAWVPLALALGAGWIVAVVAAIHAYFDWLPTTRLQARPGLWLLGLRMTDFKGHRLKRWEGHAHLRAYLIVRRPSGG
jgi:hypothetical protein